MKKEFLLLTSLTVLAIILFFVLPISNERVTESDVDEIFTENISDESLVDVSKIKLTFDVIRITPQGDAVMAGKTEPNIEIFIFDSDTKLSSVLSDPNGEWVWVSKIPLEKGIKKLRLFHIDEKGIKHESDENVVIFLEGDLKNSPIVAKFLSSDGEDIEIYNKGDFINGMSIDYVNYLPNLDILISGQMIPNKRIEFFVDNEIIGNVTSDDFGSWNFTYNLKSYNEDFEVLAVSIIENKEVTLTIPLSYTEFSSIELDKRKFVVQPGNSLWRIARKTLGGGIFYTEIFKSNYAKISDPNLIFPGQVFIIPKLNKTVNYER
ncbi:MAG: hypothetical protein CFH30_00512 [Alphaproteobacteria bacterium MarineAlpha8_Bin1]|nr:MAG: hypothetical protein CFH30_00512 [Alphaproteobacteria bacterium MarineAlpha8_Bin1]|tara:strand:+ start:805 stop:1767 length:963 start_codon:yes stop_codon:yes gene_type:complete